MSCHRCLPPRLLICAVAILLTHPVSAGTDRQQLDDRFQKTVRPFLNTFCLDCHGAEMPEARLDLSPFSSAESVAESFQTWAAVLERVEAGEMPPPDASPQPADQQRQAVARWIRSLRRSEAERNAGDPGPVLVRRLSNAEYNYTIRDLTGADIRPTKTFPVDPANEAGFDNSGESLSMSPALLNKYLESARLVVEHLVLKPNGIAFAPHPVMTDTDRDKYCVNRIVQFYRQQPTDYADYFFAAWQLQCARQAGLHDVSFHSTALQNDISEKYLQTVHALLTDDTAAEGPIAMLQNHWQLLPTDATMTADARQRCEQMRDEVVALRAKLAPTFPNLYVEGNHKGSQPFVLWKNRQKRDHRRRPDLTALIIPSETADADTVEGPESDAPRSDNQKSDAQKSDAPRAANNSPDGKSADGKSANKDSPVDTDLVLPADKAAQARHRAAFETFCSVFPDAFYISERGRDYVKDSSKQDGEKGRLLSAGFHSMMGYFRDDRPLYNLILDEAGQQEIDLLWQELDFVTSAPMRQYVGFLWFERTDSRFMRDPEFDFARPENKASLSEPMIRQLAERYVRKAQDQGGGPVEIGAIRYYFHEINQQIRWVEQARLKAESSHRQAVLEFAARAFRRPLSSAEADELLSFYQVLRDRDGLNHEEAIQDTTISVLMSPHFCYRVDLLGSGPGRQPLTDFELASRLSYFLWSSLPDQELLDLAAAGQLRDPAVLAAQADRMLRDDRVRGLATEFGGNWLDFRRFEQHNSVDRERFPAFTNELRQAMFEEPIHFLTDVARRNASVLEYLTARHTFVNRDLATHYGLSVDNIGDRWVRVDDATDVRRGGLLPMAVFLTGNSPGLRTSPVKRGYWVVRRLLGERIPPPPPGVPELPADESQLGDLTLAETLARHREHQSCAVCHDRFDSIGLAFEGFGPVGEHRQQDLGGRPVMTAVTFPDGSDGEGIDGLRNYLQRQRQEDFLDNLCRKLLSYALGRSLIPSDDLLVQDMRTALEANDHRFGSLIQAIVTSPQFLNKRSGDVPSPLTLNTN
ncbi:MAG: DUF1592 domain-containing protein [Fuerstiella sp.]